MSLLTDPITINDGSTDRIFVFKAQIFDPKNPKIVIGEWIEPAAALATASKLIIKQDFSKPQSARSLVQLQYNYTLPTGSALGYFPITVNQTVFRHPEHLSSIVAKQQKLMYNLSGVAGFTDGILDGLIK